MVCILSEFGIRFALVASTAAHGRAHRRWQPDHIRLLTVLQISASADKLGACRTVEKDFVSWRHASQASTELLEQSPRRRAPQAYRIEELATPGPVRMSDPA